MDQTSKLKLPYILAAQSQKHVTHNEALRVLDALVQLAVLDKDLGTPPGTPTEGDCYIVGASPTGAWAGHASHIAAFQDLAWAFHLPSEGWLAWVRDEDTLYAFDGTVWVPNSGGGGSVNPVSLVGVNATADATNRLSVESPASLFNHEGAGHQLKINKAAAADTASVLFQTGFSGRAEFGLAGDDDFHVKVSADGSAWHEALVFNRANGTVRGAGIREQLIANRTYYVRTDGSDSNSGFANTSGGAFLTIQKAINVVAALDISIYDVTIQVGGGVYAGTIVVTGPWVGSGVVTLRGDPTTPSNVELQANITVKGAGSKLDVSGFKMTTSSIGLFADGGGRINVVGNMEFAAMGAFHMYSAFYSNITISAGYRITGGAINHYATAVGGVIYANTFTVTLTGTPAFSGGFAGSSIMGLIESIAVTHTGAATGARYSASAAGGIMTGGAGASYFPGNSAGSATSPGWYA